MKTYKVAVYGSLKAGYGNARLLRDAKFLGDHITHPEFTMHSLGAFPGVILGGDTPITCEVYEVDASTFQQLDYLESYPNFYNRIELDTEYGKAWMYHLSSPERYRNNPVVEDGVWKPVRWG